MCFIGILEQTAIISLHGINWSIFVTEKESVYCAVRAESLNIIQVKLRYYPESPATGGLDTGGSWFYSVFKQMLRRFMLMHASYAASPV